MKTGKNLEFLHFFPMKQLAEKKKKEKRRRHFCLAALSTQNRGEILISSTDLQTRPQMRNIFRKTCLNTIFMFCSIRSQ